MSLILNGDTGVSSVDGTAAAPAFVGNDSNTGIYFPAADRIGFSEGGTQCGEFDASGNFLFNSGYGSAAIGYGCRAWVNFNGTGTPAIRADGNVTDITDNGTGDYTINFTTALVDANYSAVMGGKRSATDDGWARTQTFNTTSLQVITDGSASNARADWEVVSVAVLR
jgi:hypothetical protein